MRFTHVSTHTANFDELALTAALTLQLCADQGKQTSETYISYFLKTRGVGTDKTDETLIS